MGRFTLSVVVLLYMSLRFNNCFRGLEDDVGSMEKTFVRIAEVHRMIRTLYTPDASDD